MGNRGDKLAALSPQAKRELLKKLLKKSAPASVPGEIPGYQIPPEFDAIKQQLESFGEDGVAELFFQSFDGINNNLARHSNRDLINFCSYNYLGLSGDPVVSQAAIDAINTYGTSVSASRVVSGERPLHRMLESELADWLGTRDAIAFVGGFATNEDVVGHLFGAGDLVIYDSLIHASIQQGAKLSGASVMPFPHNNMDALDNLLHRQRGKARQTLIVVEGVYSMDGDIPDLRKLIEIKKRHKALLMVDEAHSIGVLGPTGRGISEYHNVDVDDVDLWMGTLSKAFASCGGYIAGAAPLVTYLRYTAPGFVYSVGMSPPNTAAALSSLRLIAQQPERVALLQSRARLFHQLAGQRGLDTGSSHDAAVIPIFVGGTKAAIGVSKALLDRGILVLPIGFPAVPENTSRLRFFVSSTHTEDQIRQSIDAVAECMADVQGTPER